MSKRARAFSPAGISSFFQICDKEPNGKPITDPERIGSRGGGFALKKGVWTDVEVAKSQTQKVQVFINNKLAPEAQTTRTVIDMLLEQTNQPHNVTVRHNVEVPIGAGFGTSASGALGTALALSKALSMPLTYSEIGRIAHVSEVKCKTGFGTVSGLLFGGCVIVLEPGGPKHGLVDRIPITPEYHIISGVFLPRFTKEFLRATRNWAIINDAGQKTLESILFEPSLENFLYSCRKFAEKTGLATDRLIKLMTVAEKAGAIGAAQNMLGETVHALVPKNKIKRVFEAFTRFLPYDRIVVAGVSLQGAYLAT